MKAATLAPLLASVGYALPQAPRSCHTATEQVIVPTSTATYLETQVTTVPATTAQDLGTFTDVVRVSSTKILQTLTSTQVNCTANGTVTAQPIATVYTSQNDSSSNNKRSINPRNAAQDNHPRQDEDCTVTTTSTTTYGQTYTFKPADETSTFTRYTDFTQATITQTSSGFKAYAIATATSTKPDQCGPTITPAAPASTSTTTQDTRCAPSALISAAGTSKNARQYGLSYSEGPSNGATYRTNTTDASSCCQLCVEAEDCAASSWDIRTGACRLEFPVRFDTGEMSCGRGLQAYYNAGPNEPMEPGTGLFVAEVCGRVTFANAKPDDGT